MAREGNDIQEAERLVRNIMNDRNLQASKSLEKILKSKAAKRISDVLNGE